MAKNSHNLLRIKWLCGTVPVLVLCVVCLASGEVGPSDRRLALEDCINLAVRHSFEVKLARLDFLIAQTDKRAAEAIYDTVLEIDANYEKDKREPLSVLAADDAQTNTYSLEATKELSSATEFTFSLSDERTWSNSGYVASNPAHTAEACLELRQPLGKNVFGYIDRRDISVSGLAIENADLETKERIETLFAEIEQAYWRWVFSKKRLEVYQQILKKAKDLHKTNSKNYDIGRIEKGDFLASQANILLREKDVLIAENQYRRAEEAIKLLMSVEAQYRIHPKTQLQYKFREIDLEDCLLTAFKTRRDYQRAKRELKMENIALETKTNARWPEIDLVASFAANGIDARFGKAINNITCDNNKKYYLGVEISLPIENREAQSEFEKATHKKEQALLTLKSVERRIVTKVGDAFGDYLTYAHNFKKVEQAANLQLQKLEEEEKRFKLGRSQTKTLIDYQQDYLNAQLEVAKGLLNLELAKTELDETLNIILKKYEGLL